MGSGVQIPDPIFMPTKGREIEISFTATKSHPDFDYRLSRAVKSGFLVLRSSPEPPLLVP